ncbi:hypothetical protein ACPA9J_27080 [Pseudomonas aeruginosa]
MRRHRRARSADSSRLAYCPRGQLTATAARSASRSPMTAPGSASRERGRCGYPLHRGLGSPARRTAPVATHPPPRGAGAAARRYSMTGVGVWCGTDTVDASPQTADAGHRFGGAYWRATIESVRAGALRCPVISPA